MLLAVVGVFCLCFGLAACGEEPVGSQGGNTQTEQPGGNQSGNQGGSPSGNQGGSQSGSGNNTPAPHVHSYGNWEVITPATHTTTGTRRKYCSCGDHIDETIPVTTAHEYGNWQTTREATHLVEGEKQRTCPCGAVETESIPKTTAHEYGDWVVDSPATETATGTKHKECPCGDRVTETIPLVIPFEFEQVGGGYTVKAYTGSLSEVTVPATYQEKPVTAIAQNAFRYGTMTQITLPESIVEIGASAFSYCAGLQSVDIPNCVRIGDSAFEGCSSLQEVVLPDDLVTLGGALFSDCTNLKKITIGGGSVTRSVFTGCENVQEIVLGVNVTSIAQNAFAPCKNLKSLTIPRIETSDTFMHYYFGISPETYTLSGTETFVTGGGLPDDIYPAETQSYSYGSMRFALPKGKTSWYYYYNTKNIGGKTYTYSEKPITVTSWKTCYEATVGVTYYVPEKWTAEFYCDPETTLETLNISDQIIKKTDEAFGDCKCEINILKKPTIVSMKVYSGNPEEFYPDTFYEQFRLHIEYEDETEEIVYLTKDELSAEVQAELLEEGEHTFTVEKSGQSLSVTVKIVYYTFEGAKLESKKFDYDGEPKSLEVEGAPEGTEIVYTGNGQTEPGGYSVTATLMKEFYKTITLEATLSITSDSLLIIENGEILGAAPAAQNMTNLYLGSSDVAVTAIANYAFEGFSNLQSVTIASSILSIGESAFSGCINLQSVLFEGESALQTIGRQAFYSCSKLAGIEIPDGVTSIGYEAFRGCSLITSIALPDSVIEIGSYAFIWCHGLESVTFGDESTLQTIGSWAFDGCSLITGIALPDSVTEIGYGAFSGCSGLESVTFGNESQLKTIGRSAFSGCSNLASIEIPASVTSIGDGAFYGCSSLADVTFENTDNWSAGGTPLASESLTKPNVAATYLTRTYCNSAWKREE